MTFPLTRRGSRLLINKYRTWDDSTEWSTPWACLDRWILWKLIPGKFCHLDRYSAFEIKKYIRTDVKFLQTEEKFTTLWGKFLIRVLVGKLSIFLAMSMSSTVHLWWRLNVLLNKMDLSQKLATVALSIMDFEFCLKTASQLHPYLVSLNFRKYNH